MVAESGDEAAMSNNVRAVASAFCGLASACSQRRPTRQEPQQLKAVVGQMESIATNDSIDWPRRRG